MLVQPPAIKQAQNNCFRCIFQCQFLWMCLKDLHSHDMKIAVISVLYFWHVADHLIEADKLMSHDQLVLSLSWWPFYYWTLGVAEWINHGTMRYFYNGILVIDFVLCHYIIPNNCEIKIIGVRFINKYYFSHSK